MNSDKHSPQNTRGNAMVYILITLALLGALTMVMMRQNDQGGDDMENDRAEILASQALTYSTVVKNSVDQMLMIGTPPASIDFSRPDAVTFDTAPYGNKLYHTEGGGLNYSPPDSLLFSGVTASPAAGWYIGRFNNVEWTPTTAQDIILTGIGINQKVCEKLNKKITGDATIPAVAAARSRLINVFYHTSANANFMKTDCPACEGKPMLCVSTDSGALFVYYSIISAQ